MDSGNTYNYDLAFKINPSMNENSHFAASKYDEYDVVDVEVFDLIKEQSEDDSEIVREIYLSYFSETEILMKLINEYAKKCSYEKLRMTIHSLSGISATVGAKKVKEITKDIENELIMENNKSALLLIPYLVRSITEIKKTINELI